MLRHRINRVRRTPFDGRRQPWSCSSTTDNESIGKAGSRSTNRKNKYAPGDEADLVPNAGALFLELKVVDSPPALRLREISDEFVVRCARRLLLDDDLGEVLRDVVDNVLRLLSQLELLEGFKTCRVDGDAGGLSMSTTIVSLNCI